jgi:hypothetical protein
VTDWPLFDLRLRCRDVQLAPVREADLPDLAAREPDDYELDPRLEHWRYGSEVTVTGLAACRAWFGAADPGPGGDGLTDVQ